MCVVKGLKTMLYKMKVLRVYRLKESRGGRHVTLHSNILGPLGAQGVCRSKLLQGSARAKVGMLQTWAFILKAMENH